MRYLECPCCGETIIAITPDDVADEYRSMVADGRITQFNTPFGDVINHPALKDNEWAGRSFLNRKENPMQYHLPCEVTVDERTLKFELPLASLLDELAMIYGPDLVAECARRDLVRRFKGYARLLMCQTDPEPKSDEAIRKELGMYRPTRGKATLSKGHQLFLKVYEDLTPEERKQFEELQVQRFEIILKEKKDNGETEVGQHHGVEDENEAEGEDAEKHRGLEQEDPEGQLDP